MKNRYPTKFTIDFSIARYLIIPLAVFASTILAPNALIAQCTANTTLFPATTINAGTGALVTISTSSNEGQYSRITGIVNGAKYKFNISQSTAIITVRIGSSSGTILGFGTGNVTVTATSTSDLFVHWNTSACGTAAISRTTTVQGIPVITSLGAASGCAGTSITINGTNLSGAVAANVTIGGTPVTAITSNSSTQIIATLGTGTTGTVTVSNGAGSGSSAASYTVNANPVNIIPAAAATMVCYGSGTNIQVPASQAGVNYQLRNNTGNINIGSAVAGNAGTINLPTGSLFTPTTFNVLATNATTGCNTQLSTLVTISIDNIAPTISCPANITASSTAGICGAVVNYTVTANDNCSGTNCAPASITGYTLIGTYNGHTYFRSNTGTNWATANSNAIALGAHLVTIGSAGENNFFTGLGSHWSGFTDQAVEGTWAWVTGEPVTYTSWNAGEPNNSGGTENYMQLNWSGTNWNDANGANSNPSIIEFDCLSLNMVSGYASGAVFPVGTTTVTYNATDAAGNTSSNCSFTVTVTDVTPPSIVCPANISVNAATGACNAVVNYNAPVASDNCGTCSSAPAITGYTALGVYNSNAYYISTATATGPAAFTAAAALGASVATVSSAAENTFIRNAANAAGYAGSYFIGVNDVATEGTFVGFAGETLPYTNWSAGEPNNSGNEDYTQVLNNGLWNDIGAGAANNYIIKISCITPVRTSGLASGSTFPIGVSTINYSATDPAGNTANCSFTVTVAINPASTGKTVTAAVTPVCINTGTNISIASSDNGISYQLRNNSNNTAIGSPVAGNGGTINLPTGNLSATTTFNILATGSSCSYQLTNTLTVTVNPAAAITPGATLTSCQSATPSAITLTGASVGGSATTGAWSITAGGGTLSSTAQTATPATVTYTPAANFSGNVTLTLTSNDPAGPCGAVTATRTITVNPVIANNSITSAQNICNGVVPAAFNGSTPTGGSGTYTYIWQSSTTSSSSGYAPASGTNNGINYTPGALTQTTWYRRVVSSGTCSSNSPFITILVDPVITNNTIGSAQSVCSGSTPAALTGSTPGGGAGAGSYSYYWEISTTSASAGFSVAPGISNGINYTPGSVSQTTWYRRTVFSGGCTSISATVQVSINSGGQWIGGTTGNWNTASNWCGGIPTTSTSVIIPAGVTVNIQSANAVANTITIAGTGSLVMTGAYNLNISAGGSFTNNGTFNATASTGTVAFQGNGTISGTTTFNNIDTYGALDFGTASTVSGTFSIQTGGSVTGNSPTYVCPTSILAYKPGSTFTRGLEWTNSSSGAGYPANVVVQNNTTINFPGAGDGYICYDLTINNGASLLQNYAGGSASLRVGRNVTINGTLSLGAGSGGDIYAGGNWTRNTGGVFNANDRKVTFDGPSNFSGNGSSMSTISAPASTAKDNEGGFGGEKFAHIWINKTNATDSVVLLSNITVTRELGFTNGTFSLRNSDVTIVSNSTRTADIAPVTTPAAISIRYGGTGRFVVQRFIQNPTATRSWRLLTAPLQSASAPSINAAWQEGVVNPDKANPNGSGGIYNPWPGYGTHITGPGGTYSAVNGFDQGTNAASILYANTGVNTWIAPTSTTATKITDQQGWMLFVRGDRGFTIGNQYMPSDNSTLEPKGKINIGNVTVPVVAAKQVIANPYASAISLLNIDVAGTLGKNSTYYMWDPKMFTSYTQPGKWVTFTGVGNSFVQTTSESPYLADGTVESGQAFVVDATTAGNVVFHESDKKPLSSSLVGIANATGARPMNTPVALFRSDVYANNGGSYKLTDGVLNIFGEGYNNAATAEDASKMITFNTKESLSILRNASKLAIEKRSDIRVVDTIFFSMSKFNEIAYRFRFAAENFAPGMEAFLEDKYNNTRTPVSTTDTTVADFTITADPLSKAEDRFRIVFTSMMNVLPVTLTNIKAYQQNKQIAVEWKVQHEINLLQYEIEKSADGIHFTKAGEQAAGNNNEAVYKWLDAGILTGTNYYRIKMIDRDGQFKYSSVVHVSSSSKSSISIYPNPIENNTVQLMMKGQIKGNYQMNIYTSDGQKISTEKFVYNGEDAIKVFTLSNVLPKGIYNAVIKDRAGKNISIQFSVQ